LVDQLGRPQAVPVNEEGAKQAQQKWDLRDPQSICTCAASITFW
jgi:hypothetical protein